MPSGVSLPVRAQAELTRSGVQQVLGHFAQAEEGCRRLAGVDFMQLGSGVRLSGLACMAELSSLQGHADTAAATLARLAGAPDASSAATIAGAPAPGWLELMRAELAQRRGDPAAGALFAAALKATDDVYTQCAYADWLLDQRRPADVVALLQGNEVADPVLLRIALAHRQLHGRNDPLTRAATTMLGERYDAALLRGDKSHGREQSRYELDLRGDARAALALAKSNWVVQHEPADEVVLAHAAHAAHRDATAAPLWRFLHDTGGRDVRLVGGPPGAVPAAFGTPAGPVAGVPERQPLLPAVLSSRSRRLACAARRRRPTRPATPTSRCAWTAPSSTRASTSRCAISIAISTSTPMPTTSSAGRKSAHAGPTSPRWRAATSG